LIGLNEMNCIFKQMTFQQICKDVHMVKTSGQQVFIDSRNRPPPKKHTTTGTQTHKFILKPTFSFVVELIFFFQDCLSKDVCCVWKTGALKAVEAGQPGSSLCPGAAPPSKSSAPSLIVPKEPPSTYSYQQINCLDSIIRFVFQIIKSTDFVTHYH